MNIFLVEEVRDEIYPLDRALIDIGHTIAHHASLDNAILLEIAMQDAIDLVIFNLQVMDREVLRKIYALSDVRPITVIVFVSTSDPEMTRLAIKSGISAYIIDGLDSERLQSVIDLAIARFDEMSDLHKEVNLLKTQLEERKQIERAKGVLMKFSRLSEQEAYASLRKRSMDQNKKMVEVAGEVISALELLHTDKYSSHP